LLKILEEPPPRVIFVFATTDPQRITQAAAPVMSRLQRFDFKRISPAEVRERLTIVLTAEGVGADDEALAMIARAADGSMRDALSLTDQVLSMGDGKLTASAVRSALGLVPEDEYLGLLEIIAERRAVDVFPTVGRLAESGIDFAVFLAGLADLLRAQLAVTLGGDAPEVSEQTRAALRARRDRFTPPDLLRMLGAIAEIEPFYRKSSQQQLLLETLLVRFALLDRTVELEDLLRGIGNGGGVREAGQSPSKRAPEPPRSPPRRAEAEAVAAPLADAATAAPKPSARSALDLNVLCERWGDIVDRARALGRPMLVSALEHALPVAVSAQGTVTVQLEQPNEIFERAIESGAADVLAAIAGTFDGATKLLVRRMEQTATAAADAPKRLTEDQARRERAQMLRKRDPALDAAIEELDLELLE
jgi:DNA polymerase-3 subunit gamma/tau